jgi:hypothetical protein
MDPRTANCQGYHVDANGKVDGVLLIWQPVPSSKYELIRAELVSEADAGGSTVATCVVLDKGGIQTAERVWLAWAWPELKAGWGLPGNASGQHMITNGYPAHTGALGPLGLYPGDANHNPIGDLIGGVGLPDNRHVCYRFVWRERGATQPVDGSTAVDLTATNALLERQVAILEALARHLGVPGLD